MAVLFVLLSPVMASVFSFLIRKNIRNGMRMLGWIVAAASILELSATSIIILSVHKNGIYQPNVYFSVDALGSVLMFILALVGAMASWYSVGYLKSEVEKKILRLRRVHQYFILLHLFIFAMFFAIVTTSPILMWIAIEATTLSTAFLVSFYNKPSAIEAAWKYLIINSIGVLLGFFGTLLFLYPTLHAGYKGFMTWQILLSNASGFDPFIAKIAFVFVLIGYGTKVGLVPMHPWLPDAHSKAPPPISSLLSGVLLNVAFFAVLRFKTVTDATIGLAFSRELLVFFGILSISVASFIIFIQKNYKRLLAYCSVEHMGIIALGFGFGGAGAFAGLLHMIYHSLAKSALFLLSGNVFLKYSTTKMEKVRGLRKILPFSSILFFMGFLVMAGVPPFGIFITEFRILAVGIGVHPLITVIAIFSLVLVFAAIIMHVVVMNFGKPPEDVRQGEGYLFMQVAPLVLIVALTLLSFFIPGILQSLLHSATINS